MEKSLRGEEGMMAHSKNLDFTFLCRVLYTIPQGNPSTVWYYQASKRMATLQTKNYIIHLPIVPLSPGYLITRNHMTNCLVFT